MATVTIDLMELDELRNKIATADLRTAEIQKQLDSERARHFDEKLAELADAFEASKHVVDFAVSHLHPEFIPNWPRMSLKYLAEVIAKLPSSTQRDRERSEIWMEFYRDIQKHERRRAERARLDEDEIATDLMTGDADPT